MPSPKTATLCLSALLSLAARPEAGEPNYTTHGPILGRLEATSVGVWARTLRPGEFAVRYGKSAKKLDRVSRAVRTVPEGDNTGWVKLEALEPNTRYHYVLSVPGRDAKAGDRGRTGQGGSFRTLPSDDSFRHPELNARGLFNFRFEFACGNNQNAEHSSGPALPAFATMLREVAGKVDFAILNGDWLYEARREYPVEAWRQQLGLRSNEIPELVRAAPTIVGVWENYKHFLSRGENLAAWHARVPTFFTADDHEALNDIWGAGTPGLRDRRAVFRDIGIRAWYDYLAWSNPTDFPQRTRLARGRIEEDTHVLIDEGADFTKLDWKQFSNLHIHWGTATAGVNDNSLDGVGGHPAAGVYHVVDIIDDHRLRVTPKPTGHGKVAYSLGRRSWFQKRVSNCDFFFLDTRGEREMHDKGNPAKPGLSMLGSVQQEWLLEGVEKSDADFIFVVSSVNFMIPHVGGGKVREGDNKDEAWTVFLDEREKLIEAFDRAGPPVFVLTGDLHNSFAIKITERVWEFASGPHNSNNHWATDEGDRPANGRFEYGPRACDIRWSTHFRPDIPRAELLHPTYCVVQLNNVYNNPLRIGEERFVAFPRPQVIFQFFDGRTGELRYAESILAARKTR